MTKTLNISSLIPAIILTAFMMLSVFIALPASAAEIQEKCTLTRAITMENAEGIEVTIAKGSIVTSGNNDISTGSGAYKNWGTICLLNTVNAVTDWAFFILISVAFVFILIAGFLWMTGRGEAEKMKKAGQMIGAALVGIVIALLSRVIPGVITGILT